MLYRRFYILLPITFLFYSSIFAGEEFNGQMNFLQPTALSLAKSQMTQKFSENGVSTVRPSENNLLTEDPQIGYKNRGTAFFRSMLLPGAGERYVGKKSLGKAFFITEVTLWLGYFAFREYGDWIKKDALAFAATHAGAETDGKPSQYFVNIGFYSDIYQYNDAQQRMRQFSKVYSIDEYYWAWDKDDSRSRFVNMRIASDRAHNRAIFVLGGIFANHILSAIDAVWQTYRYNKNVDHNKQARFQFGIKTNYQSGAISLNITKLF